MTSGGGGAHTDAHRTRAPSLPKLDIGKVSEQNRAGAPVTVDRLLSTLRSRWKPAHETELFQDFEDRVNEIMSGGSTGCKMDPAFRIFTFYDEAIIPAGSAQATIRTTRQVCGESPLEIIFGFFCSRQQPGTGGLPAGCTFDEISAHNLSMSFPELIKFTNMMFKDVSFTRNEMSWFMMKAKNEPISKIEGNWHGDSEGDIKLLNFIEWLACVLRMALVGYGTQGLGPDEALDRLAEHMGLYNVSELEDRLYRIARTNAGFGAWCDPNLPFEYGNPLALAVKRPKSLDDFMLPHSEMLRLQDKLMSLERTDKNRTWIPFDGPYISISVPCKPRKPHLFVVEVQNMSAEPRNMSFRLRNLPWMHAQYTPSRATIVSAGMLCKFELAAFINEPGDYSGEIHFTDKDGNGTFAICPVYIRALKSSAIGQAQALTARESNPVIYEEGTMSQRVNSPSERDPLSPLIRKTMAMLPPKPNTMDWNKKQTAVGAKDLFTPLTVRHAHW
eukprot:Tamp_09948.p1 GENE.Tamp_09948~~Tamp_09948.p1  ORF type:complete len:536 (+),score=93.10 Tamp_09948:106-1608(+)